MGLITVDAEKCIHNGYCLEGYPFRLLGMKTERSLPTPKEIEVWSAEARFINCGHCMAVCPLGALTPLGSSHGLMASPGVRDPAKTSSMRIFARLRQTADRNSTHFSCRPSRVRR